MAEAYDGGDPTARNSTKKSVTVAFRMTPRDLTAIGEVVNNIDEKFVLSNKSVATSQNTGILDARVFGKFVSFGSLRAFGNFMNACSYGLDEGQINIIFILKNWSEGCGYKLAQGDTVSYQCILASDAVKEQSKFPKKIWSASWPADIYTTKKTIFITKKWDNYL